MSSDDLDLEQTLSELESGSFVLPDAAGKQLHCDLVMKGGITSGVVYPLAVLNLARRYRFHSIGGTSAGAIAAAVTAAAEYGRESGGFNRLVNTVRELERPGFLANVFQPAPELRPLLRLLFLVLDFKRRWKQQTDAIPTGMGLVGGVLRLLWALTLVPAQLPALIGGLAGAALGALGASGWIVAAVQAAGAGKAVWQLLWGVLLIVLCGWVGGLLGTLAHLLLAAVPGNYYGVCSGRPVPGHARNRLVPSADPESPALTDWLAHTIDTIAGMPAGQPLTFGMLRAKRVPDAPTPEQAPQPIVLNTVTTNLSQGQPYILPFADKQFLFSEEEFRDLFPGYIVAHLVRHAYASKRFATPFTITDARGREHTLRFLPERDDMPALIGARMSLSFPLLLSAIPLWTISRDTFAGAAFRNCPPGQPFALRAEHMRRNWFSDGGICSNFPIHFYDQLLPPYPTFGINLGQVSIKSDAEGSDLPGLDFQWEELPETDADPEARALSTAAGAHKPERSVHLPSSYPQDRPGPLWQPIDDTLPGFLGAVLNTGLFYRDTLQSRLPSYYDRIVTIYLREREGGINLDMPPSTIAKIAGQGYLAAEEIERVFNFDHHTWVRLRMLLGKLEQGLIELHGPLFAQQPAVDQARLATLVAEITAFLEDSGLTHNAVQRVLLAQQAAFAQRATRFPYARAADWERDVLPRLYVFLLMIQQWGSAEHARLQLGRADESLAELRQHDDHIRLRVTPDL